MNENSAVKIAVRERPARETLNISEPSVINYHPNSNILIVDERPFTFDYVLNPQFSQKNVFDSLIKPLVHKLKQGFNCTALAYGQTGTGKSYTMGLNTISFEGADIGVIPRCLKELFSENNENENCTMDANEKTEISASFIEIYNEKLYDLLAENSKEPIIAKGFKYTGGTRKALNNLHDCYRILMQGNKNRHVRPTKMNLQSSRSHAIFTIHYSVIRSKLNEPPQKSISACMNIVDLAGSEGVRRTGHQGMAMSEGVNINQGLLAISKVLQAMSTGNKVIPYRDSVLSSVLQDSLNPNSYLTLLACISPHRDDLSETLSTIRFAQNAKQLKNNPQINDILASIKKSAQNKETPYRIKPLNINNCNTANRNTANRLKRPFSVTVAPKSAFKSNTFCTPKKQRVDISRCNKTDIPTNTVQKDRPKLSNVAYDFPQMQQLESTHNRESLFNISGGNMRNLNLSSLKVTENGTTFSPVIKKYLAESEKRTEEKFRQILQSGAGTYASSPVTIRKHLKSIVEEMFLKDCAINQLVANNCENKHIDKETPLKNAKCQLFNSTSELFKIPEIPENDKLAPKTSSPISDADASSAELETSFAKTFFAGATKTDKTILNKSIRRSARISMLVVNNQSNVLDNTISSNVTDQSRRRSSRKSVLKCYEDKKSAIRSAYHRGRISLGSLKKLEEEQSPSPTPAAIPKSVKKKEKSAMNSINNNVIAMYCGTSSATTKLSLQKHRRDILDLLNRGSMKDIKILPQIGQKTAFQIITHRTLNGKFKSFSQVEKLPIWRGNGWERFAQANLLV